MRVCVVAHSSSRKISLGPDFVETLNDTRFASASFAESDFKESEGFVFALKVIEGVNDSTSSPSSSSSVMMDSSSDNAPDSVRVPNVIDPAESWDIASTDICCDIKGRRLVGGDLGMFKL